MGCDIFSLIGIENIANWIDQWRHYYDQAYAQVKSRHEATLHDYTGQVRATSSVMARFIGYTVQQYITKTIRDEKRATGAYEAILAKIPREISDSLGPFICAATNHRRCASRRRAAHVQSCAFGTDLTHAHPQADSE
jgi:hypothetical protein